MQKKFFIFGLACLLSLAFMTVTWAYNPGQRTYNLIGNILNSSKQPVHVEIEQRLDLAEILKPEAYSLLKENQRQKLTTYEYNELSADHYSQRVISRDAGGALLKDMNFVVRDGYFYAIDNIAHTYDRLPNIPGLSKSFTQGLVQWFNEKPEAGADELSEEDYDLFTLGKRSIKIYFQSGTDKWLGYQIGMLAPHRVIAYNQQVDEGALALPPEDYQLTANEAIRAQANRLTLKK